MEQRRVGVAIVGLGGAVGTTAVAGVELLRAGLTSHAGLPLAGVDEAEGAGLIPYENLVFAGWDLDPGDLAKAAEVHRVLEPAQLSAVAPALSAVTPWAAVGNTAFCRNVDGANRRSSDGHRAQVEAVVEDLRAFRSEQRLDAVVVVHLASTEKLVDLTDPALATLDGFEAGLDRDDLVIGPAMLYAYAALTEGIPYANFTPSTAVDVPALTELAARDGVPVAGKDGKTGQTMMKTVLAPAFRWRGLEVEGWFSTNILGNRDGLALDDPASLASKVGTKASVLDDMLGYEVEDHLVDIRYYRPRGDNKEAWDNVDLVGFLGQRMQLKINFLCRDSVLAAPLVLELARLLDLASRRGDGGVQEHLGLFFKAPMTADGSRPEHALHRQQFRLMEWLTAPV